MITIRETDISKDHTLSEKVPDFVKKLVVQESYEKEDVTVIPRYIFDKLFHGED